MKKVPDLNKLKNTMNCFWEIKTKKLETRKKMERQKSRGG